MLIVDTLIVILALLLGIRKGGMAICFTCGAALTFMVFVCGLRPTSPPIAVMLIILSVTSLGGVLQCSGGLEYLISIAERILRKHPNFVTVLAPLITFLLVTFTGTAFMAMALLPVIAEVSRGAGVRPERALGSSSCAAVFGLVASPISAATAALIAILATYDVNIGKMMLVLLPSLTIGVILGGLSVYHYGLELPLDSEYQRRLKTGEIPAITKKEDYVPSPKVKLAVGVFAMSILIIVLLGTFKGLLPHWTVKGKTISRSIVNVIELVCLTTSAILIYLCDVKTKLLTKSSVFLGGISGVMVCFGICFMSDTYFAAHKDEIIALFGGILNSYPWMFAVVLAFVAAVMMSPGATTAALIPIGLSLGIPAPYLVAMFPAVCANWIFPVHPNLIASVALDSTGSTSLGTWLFNHSSMRPGLVMLVSSICMSFVLVYFVF